METSYSVNDNNFHFNTGSNPQGALLGSQYGLKLALQTMKERCQKLQKRLTCLEDENLQLRIERHTVPGLMKKEPKSEFFSLQKQVEELNRHKSLLCHHIYMVAMENKELWERLYKVTGNREMTDNKNNHGESFNNNLLKPEKSINVVESCFRGGRDDSMEEIPLKVISSFKKNKSLFDDRNEEVSDTKSGDMSLKECEFTLDIDVDEENGVYEGLVIEIKRILEKLRNEKIVLKQQQEGLKSALEIIAKFIKDKQTCKNCMILKEELENLKTSTKEADIPVSNHQEESFDSNLRREPNFNISRTKENTFEDRICPLCTKFYPKSTPFDEFNEHVLSHFVEEPDEDSLMRNLIKRTEKGLSTGIEDYNNDIKSKELMDRVQIRYHCCGVISYKDWFRHEWFEKRSELNENKNLRIRPIMNEHIPFSCCSNVLLRPCTHHFIQSDKHFYDYDFVGGTTHTFWTEGCLKKVSNNYLSAFHTVNMSNILIMTLYLIQFVFDRIIQTADSTTFSNSHLKGWVFKRPAMYPRFLYTEKENYLRILKRKLKLGTSKLRDRDLLMPKKKRENKTRRSVQFHDVVESYPDSEGRKKPKSRNEHLKLK
ncbi:protein spindle-F isoform X2 [Halyomorpha halys]|uniref:protein spindle-F isoform X2 n=1 Tax=Halyomorpha halys TaxID=286706 RepID=UPI0034D378ED